MCSPWAQAKGRANAFWHLAILFPLSSGPFCVQLFLFLNDLAGRWPWADALMRAVYVATIPVLAVVLIGLLTLAPRGNNAVGRSKIVFATLLALGGAAGVMWGVDALSSALHLGTISPRPFMTRWVNLLIVEPQDNSFPCAEMIVATILAMGIVLAHQRWSWFAAVALLLLGVARLFCGSNYGADVGVAALLGAGLMLCALALGRAAKRKRARWSLAGLGAATLGLTALGTFLVMAASPRFERQLPMPWATAQFPKATVAAHSHWQEGEGASSELSGEAAASPYAGEAEALALSKRSTLFLPQSEAYLRRVLEPRARPFELLDVEVAPVNWKEKSYRAAALRFGVQPNTPDARRLVASRAQSIVKTAFAADARLDNVDIVAVMSGDTRAIDGSEMKFAGDEVPIFTASIQRRNLILKTPIGANSPTLAPEKWLAIRSKLWINPRVLPYVKPKPTPRPTPVLSDVAPRAGAMPLAPSLPKPTATPRKSATPTATPQKSPKPTAKPQTNATPQKTAAPKR